MTLSRTPVMTTVFRDYKGMEHLPLIDTTRCGAVLPTPTTRPIDYCALQCIPCMEHYRAESWASVGAVLVEADPEVQVMRDDEAVWEAAVRKDLARKTNLYNHAKRLVRAYAYADQWDTVNKWATAAARYQQEMRDLQEALTDAGL